MDTNRQRWTWWAPRVLPALLIIVYTLPIVPASLPNTVEDLDESYEPVKTLALIEHIRPPGSNWGPMPNLIYAPIYSPVLYYWHLTGALERPTDDYPLGFRRPLEQMGLLILLARLTGLAVALLAVFYYGLALSRAVQSPWIAAIAMTLCVATGPDIVYKFAATKPDGLMLAFLALSMGAYVSIVTFGLTFRRGVLLALSAVASISCKEQTAPAFVAMFGWLAVAGLRRESDGTRARFLGRYASTMLVGIAAYALINIVFSPQAWWTHVRFWTGSGTNPAIWAGSGYSLREFFKDAIDGLFFNLGPAGCAATFVALLISFVFRPKGVAAAWAPALGYLVLLMLTVGYMPRYFLAPMNILLAFPVALALSRARQSIATPPSLKFVATAAVALLLGGGIWSGNMSRIRFDELTPLMEEQYVRAHVLRDETLHLANLWPRWKGASRLSYLGYRVDDRALGQLLAKPADLPDVILIDREQDVWLRDFRARPERDQFFRRSGYSYAQFAGIEPLGYSLAGVILPQNRRFMDPVRRGWPWYRHSPLREVLVYRRRP
jgi:hypothetical protein